MSEMKTITPKRKAVKNTNREPRLEDLFEADALELLKEIAARNGTAWEDEALEFLRDVLAGHATPEGRLEVEITVEP